MIQDDISTDSDEKTVSPLMVRLEAKYLLNNEIDFIYMQAQEFSQLPKRLQSTQQSVFDDEVLYYYSH